MLSRTEEDDLDREYPGRVIRNVYLFANGSILVFDERGVQWPKFQGPVCLRRWPLIKENTRGEESYFVASGRGWSHQISRSEFLAMCGDETAYEVLKAVENT